MSFIIGLGTGRCGTYSLAKLLQNQGLDVTHEDNWYPQDQDFIYYGTDNKGDVGFYYLDSIGNLCSNYPDIKCIVLQRPKLEVIASWSKRSPYNYWSTSEYGGDVKGNYEYFPKYNAERLEALGLYWETYKSKTHQLLNLFPDNIGIWDMHWALNTVSGMNSILDFIEVPKSKRNMSKVHLGKSQTLEEIK